MNPTAAGTARLVLPFALAVVVVVLVAGLAFGTATRRDDAGRAIAADAASVAASATVIYSSPKTT